MWRSKFDNTCRLCLKDSAEYSLFEDRISIKIMICLQVDVEENDSLPQKVCIDCRTLLEQIYLFRSKVQENDQALRKLISVGQTPDTRFVESKTYLKQCETSQIELKDANASVSKDQHSNMAEEHLEEYLQGDYEEVPMEEDQDYDRYSIEIVDHLNQSESSDTVDGPNIHTRKNKQKTKIKSVKKEENSDHKPEQLTQFMKDTMKSLGYEKPFTYDLGSVSSDGSQTVKVKKDDGTSIEILARLHNRWFDHPGEEPTNLKHITLPTNFPLKNVSEVYFLEKWLNESTGNYEKLIHVIRKKFSTSPNPSTAMKNLFSYNIAHGFVHPSGHRKENMTSISDVRLFTDVFEDVLRGCDFVDIKQLWKDFFRLGRNWIRTTRSRQKSKNVSQPAIDLT